MSRPLRIEYPGAWYHVMNRGSWTELGLIMKDKVLRFEVLAEDEWQAKLNEMLQD